MTAEKEDVMKKKKWFFLIILTALFFVLGACGRSADFGGGTAGDGTQNTIVADQTNRKIVYYVRMSLKTKKIGAAKEELIEQGNGFGGYIFEQNEVFDDGNYSEVYLVFKIPTAKLEVVVSAIGEKGKVSSKNITAKDINTEYVDAQATKGALLSRREALEALLGDATLAAADKITVIREIADVDTQLQAIELQLKNYDSLVDYSTVSLRISEESSVWEVIGVVFFVLVIVGMFVAVVVLGVKLSNERRRKRSDGTAK